jgi:hypothetical protein
VLNTLLKFYICGFQFSEEQREKLRESHKGKKQSSETVDKRVAKNIGKKRTDEQRDAGSAHPQARELAQPLHEEFIKRNYISIGVQWC